jgi:hypothetical protein
VARELGHLAVVQRERRALVLDEDAGMAGGEIREQVAQPVERLRVRGVQVHRAVAAATLAAVLARDRKHDAGEQHVDVADRAAGDQRERAAEDRRGLGQRHAEERVDVDAVGRLGELDQRAVDVEEQRVRVQ